MTTQGTDSQFPLPIFHLVALIQSNHIVTQILCNLIVQMGALSSRWSYRTTPISTFLQFSQRSFIGFHEERRLHCERSAWWTTDKMNEAIKRAYLTANDANKVQTILWGWIIIISSLCEFRIKCRLTKCRLPSLEFGHKSILWLYFSSAVLLISFISTKFR